MHPTTPPDPYLATSKIMHTIMEEVQVITAERHDVK